jgi:hypothetical protein
MSSGKITEVDTLLIEATETIVELTTALREMNAAYTEVVTTLFYVGQQPSVQLSQDNIRALVEVCQRAGEATTLIKILVSMLGH